jgi:hypothetical protein
VAWQEAKPRSAKSAVRAQPSGAESGCAFHHTGATSGRPGYRDNHISIRKATNKRNHSVVVCVCVGKTLGFGNSSWRSQGWEERTERRSGWGGC